MRVRAATVRADPESTIFTASQARRPIEWGTDCCNLLPVRSTLSALKAGQALGLSQIVIVQLRADIPGLRYSAAHPDIPDSVLNYDPKVDAGHTEPDCSPHPFDLMALYAIYQNKMIPVVTISGPTSGRELTQVTLSASVVDNLTSPYRYEWSSGPWGLSYSPSNTSNLVTVTLPDVDSAGPDEERRVLIQVNVTDTNGRVGRDRHEIAVRP